MARARIELATPRFSVVTSVFGLFPCCTFCLLIRRSSAKDALHHLGPFPGVVLPSVTHVRSAALHGKQRFRADARFSRKGEARPAATQAIKRCRYA
jgi:hypothetical protein